MSAHSSSEKSSIWSVINMVIGLAIGGVVLLWVLAFVVKGLGSLIPAPKADPSAVAAAAPASAAAAAPAADIPALEITIKPDSANPLAYDTKSISAKAGQKVKLQPPHSAAAAQFCAGQAGRGQRQDDGHRHGRHDSRGQRLHP
jgi:hypothetical protein